MRCSNFDNTNIKNHVLHNTPTPNITKAYLFGVLHDSTKTKYTYRICQKESSFIQLISKGIKSLGYKSWVYREGKFRNLYVVEFSRKLLNEVTLKSKTELIDYVRGYFDSEGGVPRSLKARYYIYFAQKNLEDLSKLRNYLLELDIECGVIHNPSRQADPNYFRFYVLRKSHEKFGELIGSFHPAKSKYVRKKI